MTKTFIHKSDNNNVYLYDDQRRLSMLIHPEFEKNFNNSIHIDPYYSKKKDYLSKYGFFTDSKNVDFKILEESVVKDSIINTKQIVFEVTDSCNLNCTYCALGELYDGYDKRIGKKINISYSINLLKYIFDNKPKNKFSKLYISFYGGEALLNMDFIKRIVDISKQLNSKKEIEIEYSITTNATLIHKHIDFLAQNKFELLVSLDGNEENHSYRVFAKSKKNSFHKVIENIDLIQKKYPEYFKEYINFNAVLHDKSSVKDIYEFIYTRYHKIPRISELNTRNIKVEKIELLKNMFRRKWESEVEFQDGESELSKITRSSMSLYSELTDFLKFISINYYLSHINALFLVDEEFLPTNTCTPFSKKIFLTNRNKLLPCEKINYKYSLGNVDDKKIDIDITKITEQYNFYYNKIKKSCQSCYAYRHCGVCLFHLSNIDSINSEEFVCENFKGEKAFKNKLCRIFSYLEKYPADFSQILENVLIIE